MKKESRLIYLICALFFISIITSLNSPSSSPSSSHSGSTPLFQKEGIAVIEINGPISFPTTPSSYLPMGANHILAQCRLIEDDPYVKGVLVRINSPGGTVGASQEIYQALKRIKEKRNIPIVSQIGDVGASGGYYVALGSDTIFANPGSLVGSIGVILGNINIEKLSEDIGISHTSYKGGLYKDILSIWRQPTDNEDAMLNALVDNVHNQFIDAFETSRQLSRQQAESLAQGQIYTGEQALSHDLIDTLGGYQDAVTYIGTLTNLGENPHIISKTKQSVMDFLSLWTSQFQTQFSTSLHPFPQLK